MPQKEPSPLLDRKIEELEAKFADMTDEELEDLGDDDGELGDHSMPQMQSSLSSDMDIMPYTPPQVGVFSLLLRSRLNRLVDLVSLPLCGFLCSSSSPHQNPLKVSQRRKAQNGRST